MFEFNRKKNKQPRQSWQPSKPVRILGGAWLAVWNIAKIAIGAVATVLMILLVCGFVFIGIAGDYLQNDIIPESDMVLDGYDVSENSDMLAVDSDGNIQLLQRLYAASNRKWIAYKDIPKNLINAAIAIEDKRFYQHQGVDWITTTKACLGMFFGTSDAGGSSITQQLIKNVTQEDSITVQRKVMEIFRAITFEKRYTKEVVLEWYLNYIYLGNRCDGVAAAAEKYFGKEVQSLNVAECAALISITNNPSLYDPYSQKEYEWPRNSGMIRNGYERNKYRKELVLKQMHMQGLITDEEFDEAMNYELVLKSGIAEEDRWAYCHREDYEGCGYEGTVGTFTKEGEKYYCPNCGEHVEILQDSSQAVYSWYVDAVLKDVAMEMAKRDGMDWNDATEKELEAFYKEIICRSGYHIYTTIDLDVQAEVDRIYEDLSQIPDPKSAQQLLSSIVIIDNRSGDIVALSGGVGEKKVFDALSYATEAKLQTGSSIKPLTVYAPAFEQGLITPATVIKDLPYMYNADEEEVDENGDPVTIPWPRNDDRIYQYRRTVFQGVVSSVNAIAVNTLDVLGTPYSFNYAKEKFRLSGLVESYQKEPGAPILSDVGLSPVGMGAQTHGVTARDMAAAFATFANNGTYREARTFTKVYDNKGNLILDNTQDSETILSEKTVNYMNYCLDNAVQSGTGTAADLLGGKMATAGKTGTTADGKDRWFCGFTHYYTAAAWAGFRIPEKIEGLSVNAAAYLWNKVLTPLHKGKQSVPLYDDDKLMEVTICLESGKLASDACRHDIRGTNRLYQTKVYEEDMPTSYCDQHIAVDHCVDGAVTDYCKLFYMAGQTGVSSKGLVKLTQAQFNELLEAEGKGIASDSIYLDDRYVYLTDNRGNPVNSYKGFHGSVNANYLAPCIMCTHHTKAAWDAFVATHPQYADLKVSDYEMYRTMPARN